MLRGWPTSDAAVGRGINPSNWKSALRWGFNPSNRDYSCASGRHRCNGILPATLQHFEYRTRREHSTPRRVLDAENADAIGDGKIGALVPSSGEFIVKASGIKSRYVMDKTGILDPALMRPLLPERSNDEISILEQMAIAAGRGRIKG